MDKLIDIEGETYRIAGMIDAAHEITNNPQEACVLIICDPNLPEGVKKNYWSIEIVKGTLEQELAN